MSPDPSQVSSLWMYYSLMFGMAFFGSGAAAVPALRIVTHHFDCALGTALGLVISIAALSFSIWPPFFQYIIDKHSWQVAYLTIPIIVVVGGVIIFAFLGIKDGQMLGDKDEKMHLKSVVKSDASFSYVELLKNKTFWILTAAFFGASVASTGLIVHFVPMLEDAGYTASVAAGYIGLIGLSQFVSRLGAGVLVDHFYAPRVAATLMVCSGGGFIAFGVLGPEFALLGAIAAGMAFGSESDLLTYLTGRYYDRKVFGRVFGVFYLVYLAGTALSPVFYGALAQTVGYSLVLLTVGGLLLASAVIFLMLPDFRKKVVEEVRTTSVPIVPAKKSL